MTTSRNYFALTLDLEEAKSNILDGITLFEPIDEDILDKLLNSTLLLEVFHNPICTVMHANEHVQLVKYKHKIVDGRACITYKRSPRNPFGRSNPEYGVGLYSIRRQIRHT